jgi:tRNA isopentenyl-2-thiomethyl-A-37 hydroxylase MiaE
MKLLKIACMTVLFACAATMTFASDRTDALDLMNKYDKESKIIEGPVKNFGDEKELARFADALAVLKQGKVKQAQANYLDAKVKFQEYLKIQGELYATISAKYIERTKKLIDDIAEDLADFVGEEAVLKSFNTANQNLEEAKAAFGLKQYQNALQPCRLAKTAVIGVYAMAKKDIPEKYLRDVADNANKIYEEPAKN